MSTGDEEAAWFYNTFFEELDSWFSADIACCSKCYDKFVRQWPAVYLRDINFQNSGIELDMIYEGTVLRELYTEHEYWQFVKQIKCPYGKHSLGYSIWPYNFPFSPPKGFERKADHIASIAKSTPFLVFRYKFAKEIFKAIREIGNIVQPVKLKKSYFRARLSSQIENLTVKDFERPPAKFTSEGRYNHAGMPVLYLANGMSTCFLELGSPSIPIYIAEINLLETIKVLDLTDLKYNTKSNTSILSALVYSSLISAPRNTEGWNQSQYVFSRFVADCAKAVGLDAVKYPTTRASSGHNLVIFDESYRLPTEWQVKAIVSYDGKKATPLTVT
jgi:RES domain-containing protein